MRRGPSPVVVVLVLLIGAVAAPPAAGTTFGSTRSTGQATSTAIAPLSSALDTPKATIGQHEARPGDRDDTDARRGLALPVASPPTAVQYRAAESRAGTASTPSLVDDVADSRAPPAGNAAPLRV